MILWSGHPSLKKEGKLKYLKILRLRAMGERVENITKGRVKKPRARSSLNMPE